MHKAGQSDSAERTPPPAVPPIQNNYGAPALRQYPAAIPFGPEPTQGVRFCNIQFEGCVGPHVR